MSMSGSEEVDNGLQDYDETQESIVWVYTWTGPDYLTGYDPQIVLGYEELIAILAGRKLIGRGRYNIRSIF